MGSAEKINSFNSTSELQLGALMDEKLNQAEIERINDRKAAIWQQVQKAAEFSDREKNEIKTTLETGLKDDSINAINTFSAEIERRRKRIGQMVDTYFGTLDQNKQYFAKREGYDAIKLYKEGFLALDENGKQEWLDALQEEIRERIELHEELSAHVSKDQLARMRRSELKRMELYLRECDNILLENKDIFSPQEIDSFKSQIADCTSHRDQMRLLTKITGQIEKRKWYAQVYRRLPPKYRQVWGDISKMTFEDRETGYEKVIVKIEEDYEETLNNHPDRKHIGSKDREEALKYVRSEQTSGGDKFRALKNLDSQIKKQKKEVSDPFESALEKLAAFKGPKEIKNLRDRFYDTPTYDERKQITVGLLEELMEATNESAEAKELTSEYHARLNADLSGRIIGKETHKEALKRWEQKDLDERRETMTIYTTDRDRRVKLLKEFLGLPTEIQKQNFDFFQMTHTDRAALIAKLHGIKTPEINKADTEKVTETETSPDAKIEKLAALAATKARNQEYEKAANYYEQILEIDPDYEIAKISLAHLQKRLNEEENKTEQNEEKAEKKLASDKLGMVKRTVEAATNTGTVKKRRKRNEISRHLVEESKLSESIHGSNKVKNKTKGLDRRGRKLAEDLYDYSGGSYMLQKGEATRIIWSHYKGFRKKNDENAEALIERHVRKEIVNDSSKDPFNAIQFYNDSDGVSNAQMAEEELEKRDTETRKIIKNTAKKNLADSKNPDPALEKAIEEEVDEKDLSVELRAA